MKCRFCDWEIKTVRTSKIPGDDPMRDHIMENHPEQEELIELMNKNKDDEIDRALDDLK